MTTVSYFSYNNMANVHTVWSGPHTFHPLLYKSVVIWTCFPKEREPMLVISRGKKPTTSGALHCIVMLTLVNQITQVCCWGPPETMMHFHSSLCRARLFVFQPLQRVGWVCKKAWLVPSSPPPGYRSLASRRNMPDLSKGQKLLLVGIEKPCWQRPRGLKDSKRRSWRKI